MDREPPGHPNPYVLDSTLARRAFSLSGAPVGGGGTDTGGGGAGVLWVNEVHYDNDGGDTGEGVELAGPAGTSLAGWSLVLYNGNGGGVYQTVALSGTVPDQQGGLGTVWTAVAGLQNGAPDGFALVDPAGAVVEFLSYEGTLTAADGPAAGLTSVDLGVAETGSTPTGHSLQRVGEGATAADFAWAAPRSHSRGSINGGQTIGEPGARTTGAAAGPAALAASVYPNPALGRAVVSLRLDAPAEVAAEVLDALGRRVAVVAPAAFGPGFQSLDLALDRVPAGVYFVRVTAGARVAVLPLSVVR